MPNITLHALHGFLGLTTDWDFLQDLGHLVSYNIYDAAKDYKSWTSKFNAGINPENHNIIIGYSLGARLALHALIDQPRLWQKAIIVSGHPGLPAEERKARIEHDAAWAKRFELEPWEPLLHDWNNQEVFCGITPIPRLEQQFNRKDLANLFNQYSLGRQEDLSPKITDLPLPILWIAGERDLRYKILADKQRLSHSSSRKWIAPHAGHRVPWESQQAFYQEIKTFIFD